MQPGRKQSNNLDCLVSVLMALSIYFYTRFFFFLLTVLTIAAG